MFNVKSLSVAAAKLCLLLFLLVGLMGLPLLSVNGQSAAGPILFNNDNAGVVSTTPIFSLGYSTSTVNTFWNASLAFVATTSAPLARVDFKISRDSVVSTGDVLVAKLFLAGSSGGVGNVPVGEALAVSDPVLQSSLSYLGNNNLGSWVSFDFTSNMYSMVSGVTYCIVLDFSSFTNVAGNLVYFERFDSGGSSAARLHRFETTGANPSGVWVTFAYNQQFKFILYGEVVPGAFSVVYNGNGASGGSVPVDVGSPYVAGSTVTVLGVGDLVRSGYVFLGWSTWSGGEVYYVPDDPLVLDGNVVLFAVWGSDSSGGGDGGGGSGSGGGGVVGDSVLFGLFAVVVLVAWVISFARGSFGFYGLSGGLWVALGFALLVFGAPGDGFVVGFTYICFAVGAVMVFLMFWELYRMVKCRSKNNVEESVF